MARQENANVLVLGGGMSGLCAAISALEQGATVLVLEKGTRYGGSMYLSNGLIWTYTNPALVRKQIPDGDQALQDFVVEGVSDAYAWLVAQGVQLEPEQPYQDFGRGRQSNPAQMSPALVKRVEDLGGRILLGTALQSLLTENGAVVG